MAKRPKETGPRPKAQGSRPKARGPVSEAPGLDRAPRAPSPNSPLGLGPWAFGLLLFSVTLAAYYPAWHGGVLWDDDAHLTKPALQSLDGLRQIWFDVGATQQYYPVTHSAFWLMHRLWGDDTLGYHL